MFRRLSSKKTISIIIILLGIIAYISLNVFEPTGFVLTEQNIGLAARAIEKKASPPDGGLDGNHFLVSRVIDGDTIVIKDTSGIEQKVRLLGVNTPETVDPRKKVECFGMQASAKTKEALLGNIVRIERDDTQGKYDKYGRMLAYVFLEDTALFNELLISDGYAYEYTYRLPYKYQKQFREAESVAREEKRGLWAPGVCES